MAQELLPEGINLSKDTHNLILACAVEFLHMLTFQANEICQKESRSGFIGLQHVVKACEQLGFHEYVCEIEAVTAIYDRQLKLMQRVCIPLNTVMLIRVEESGKGGLVG
jgi:down-regulator of transcription 1